MLKTHFNKSYTPSLLGDVKWNGGDVSRYLDISCSRATQLQPLLLVQKRKKNMSFPQMFWSYWLAKVERELKFTMSQVEERD